MRRKERLALVLVVVVYVLMCVVSINILNTVSDQMLQLEFVLVILFPAISAFPLLGGFIVMVQQRDRLEHEPSDAEIIAHIDSLSDDTKKRLAFQLTKILQEELA